MDILYQIIGVFLSLWWLWLPVALFASFIELWTKYLKIQAVKKINWILLEVKVPRDVQRTPKSMEQIFAGFHGVQAKIKFWDKYWKGKVQEWFSLEIAGIDGGVYFFVRTPEQYRNLVEAQIYAQYPGAEIHETLDYAGPLANKVPSKNFDIAGVELVLVKDDFYPLRTYPTFEEKEEERRVDPMAAFLEILSKLKPGENIFVQYVVKPLSLDEEKKIKEAAQAQIDKMHGRKKDAKKGFFGNFTDEAAEFMIHLVKGVFVFPEWAERKSDEKSEKQVTLSPGEKLVAEGIEAKVSKLLFKSSIRFAYIARSDVFNKANIAAVLGAFKQFNTVNMNGFKPNGDVGTSADYPFFKKRREYLKKKDFIERYIKRKWPRKPKGKDFTLNAEELATVYHYPLIVVAAPTLRRVESKKAEPPVSLPVG